MYDYHWSNTYDFIIQLNKLCTTNMKSINFIILTLIFSSCISYKIEKNTHDSIKETNKILDVRLFKYKAFTRSTAVNSSNEIQNRYRSHYKHCYCSPPNGKFISKTYLNGNLTNKRKTLYVKNLTKKEKYKFYMANENHRQVHIKYHRVFLDDFQIIKRKEFDNKRKTISNETSIDSISNRQKSRYSIQ